jgi:hypothetical protein
MLGFVSKPVPNKHDLRGVGNNKVRASKAVRLCPDKVRMGLQWVCVSRLLLSFAKTPQGRKFLSV